MSDAGRQPLPRNVAVLGIVSLLTDVSTEMITPVLPLFLLNVLHAPVAAIGLVESVAAATASFSTVFSGWLSDRVGRRRPLISIGYTLSNIIKPLLAVVSTWPSVLLLRFSDRLGKGIRTAPRDALIADSGTPQSRGRDFGVHRALDTLGAALGPLTAWLILTLVPHDYRLVFLVSAIPGTLAVLVVLFGVREVRARRSGRARSRPALRLKGLGRPFAIFAAISAVFALGNSSDALLILRAQDVGTLTALVPLMYFVYNMVAAVLLGPFGSLSDRVSRKRMIALGFAGYALVYAGFALAHHPITVWLMFAAYGVPYALTEAITRAYVVDLVDPKVRATAVGGYTFVLGLAALPASLVGGLLWDSVSHAAPFWFSFALMMTAAVVLAIVPIVGGRTRPTSVEMPATS